VYPTPTCAAGKVHVNVNVGGVIVMVAACVAVCAGAPPSVTKTVNVTVPAAVGVPVTAPVAELIFTPAGNAPTLIEYV
jgi:hypothetical protein